MIGMTTSELAHELRERFRAEHQGCDEHICPFPNMYAEDIDEVLSAAGVPALRAEVEQLRARVAELEPIEQRARWFYDASGQVPGSAAEWILLGESS